MSEHTQTSPDRDAGSEAVRRTARVRGSVQGVGFRMATAQEAERLGVTGTVRNLVDGTVEADVEGAPDAVERMLAWLHEGPSSARVEDVDVSEGTPRGAASFEVR